MFEKCYVGAPSFSLWLATLITPEREAHMGWEPAYTREAMSNQKEEWITSDLPPQRYPLGTYANLPSWL